MWRLKPQAPLRMEVIHLFLSAFALFHPCCNFFASVLRTNQRWVAPPPVLIQVMFRPQTAYLFDLNNSSPVYLNYAAHMESQPWDVAEIVNLVADTCARYQLRPRSVNISGGNPPPCCFLVLYFSLLCLFSAVPTGEWSKCCVRLLLCVFKFCKSCVFPW